MSPPLIEMKESIYCPIDSNTPITYIYNNGLYCKVWKQRIVDGLDVCLFITHFIVQLHSELRQRIEFHLSLYYGRKEANKVSISCAFNRV